MSLFVHTEGQGPDIVFLHGWGMNSEVWFELQQSLKSDFRVTLIDLPGHGRSADCVTPYSIEALTELLAQHIPNKCVLIGWSLGGLLAQAFTLRYPDKIEKLVLIASSAQFQQSDDWPWGMKPEVLDGFVQNLEKDYKATLQQFLMLQALGAQNAKQTIRELKQRLFVHGEPDLRALYGGLMLLKNVSLKKELNNIDKPVLLINGRLDGLVPVAAGEQMQLLLSNAELKVIDKAAHAPFISHVELCVQYLKEFLN